MNGSILIANSISTVIITPWQKLWYLSIPAGNVTFQGTVVTFQGATVTWQGA